MADCHEKQKVAVVLFNLGGPDSLKAVKPFLFNLFYDPAIIALKNPLRWVVAKLISSRRAPIAKEIYKQMGGKSPILPQTEAQASALEELLNLSGDITYRCFISMRYWTPVSGETAQKVAAFTPDRIVLLPLYPHYSITTTGSSFIDWMKSAATAGLTMPYRAVRQYPDQEKYIAAQVKVIEDVRVKLDHPENYRILYSAHGLPEKIIEAGDPYRDQIEMTCRLVQEKLGNPDHMLCFQSRVGPLKWIEPYTEDAIKQTVSDNKGIIIVPIAFVSEHSETLVELDIEYREMATELGAKDYVRVPAIGCQPEYIKALAHLTRSAFND
ncbi:ferrochelatase [Paremcibacter congregatus]|uniref:ferrochelatase n=1 Tax=Paremcibacter congregatus TaxID=2043170 RepID=UPI003A934981